MGKHTPYAVLLRLRKTQREQAVAKMVGAQQEMHSAEQRVEQKAREAAFDHREKGDAQMWSLLDDAHEQKRRELTMARDDLDKASEILETASLEHLQRRQDEAVIERVAEKRIAKLRQEALRKEQRELDDHTLMRFARES